MEDIVKQVKNEYFRKQYAKDPSKQARANDKYWYNKACKELGKDSLTDEEVREFKNAWYRKYTAQHRAKIKANQDKFYLSQAERKE